MVGTGYRPWAWSMVSPWIGAGRRASALRLLSTGFFIGFALKVGSFFIPDSSPIRCRPWGVFPIVPDSFLFQKPFVFSSSLVRAERIELSRAKPTAPSRPRVYQFHHAR